MPRPAVSGPIYGPGARYGYGYGYPYRPYYPYYGYGYRPYYPYYPYYPWYGGWGFSIGFGFGYGYPWYGAVGFGYPYGPYGYPFYPYYPYGGPYDTLTASLRLEVKPREAEVYVDGYRAGTVDNFDGVLQRLRMPPGEHNVSIYLDGFRRVDQQVYLGHGANQNIKLAMEKLPDGEANDPRPVPVKREERAEPEYPVEQQRPVEPRRSTPPDVTVEGQGPRDFGVLALLVQPADAEILIDGAPWKVPEGETRLNVQLPAGRHKIEIRKPGFATYAEEVAIQRGRRFPLNVSLIRVPAGGTRVMVARGGS